MFALRTHTHTHARTHTHTHTHTHTREHGVIYGIFSLFCLKCYKTIIPVINFIGSSNDELHVRPLSQTLCL